MSKRPKPSCASCRFWGQASRSGIPPKAISSCRRYPPEQRQDKPGIWPTTYALDWCGEHQPRQKR